jgi:hypothetical protein
LVILLRAEGGFTIVLRDERQRLRIGLSAGVAAGEVPWAITVATVRTTKAAAVFLNLISVSFAKQVRYKFRS